MIFSMSMRDQSELNAQESMFDNLKRQFHCAIPAVIQDYDNTKGTVSAVPAIRELLYDQDGRSVHIELPLLLDVPLLFPSGGGYVITFPVKKGDECLVLFGDMCIDGWWQNGGTQNMAEIRRHDLSDGFAILAPFSQKKIKDFSTFSSTVAELRNSDGTQKIQLSDTAVNLVGNVLKNGQPIGGGGGSSDWSDITNKPTTISGYGITDAKIVGNTITLGSDSITVPNVLEVLTNISASSWVSDSTYPDFSYKCVLSVSGHSITSTTYADVTFSESDAISGNYAPVCETGTNTITIYGKVNTSITIPSILIVRAS